MSSVSTDLPTPEEPRSVSGAPNLPAGFADTFTSQFVDTGDVRLHAVIGGDGPPLLLIHGWPQTWYAWRRLMPDLAADFEVIAVDQRGIGLSDKPESGYDAGTLAADARRGDGRAGTPAVRGLRDRHRHADRVRAGRGLSRSGRPHRCLRVADAGRVCLAAAVRPAACQRPPVASDVQPASCRSERGARQGTRGRVLRRRVRRLGRDDEAARRGSRVLRRHPCLRRRTHCAAVSASTVRSASRGRRTKSARRADSPCPSSRSVERKAPAAGSQRRWRSSPTTSRPSSFPPLATGSPSRRPRSCSTR